MIRRIKIQALYTALIALLTVAPDAHAYLDPSTGSMIVSAIVGIFATLSLAIKTYWYRLKALFRRRRTSPRPAPAGNDAATGSDEVPEGGGRP